MKKSDGTPLDELTELFGNQAATEKLKIVFGEDWKNLEIKFLLNKVNPVGGKFDLKSDKGLEIFYEDVKKIIDKFNLQKDFPKL